MANIISDVSEIRSRGTSSIACMVNGNTTLTIASNGINTGVYGSYMSTVTVLPGTVAGEGGQIDLIGATGYTTIAFDNYQGNARFSGMASGKGLQILHYPTSANTGTSWGVHAIRATGFVTETWITPTMLNGWIVYDGGFNQPGYYKDKNGMVHLRGLIKNGTVGAAAFTLPTGYRPASQELMNAITFGEVNARVDIATTGNVVITSGNNLWLSLDGIKFRAV